MLRLSRVHRASLSVIVALATASPTIPVAAAPSGDGEATREACQKLGFEPGLREGRFASATGVASVGGVAPSAMYAPPPPSASPKQRAAGRAMNEMTATARRHPGPIPQPRPGDIETERYPNATPNPVKR